MPIWIDVAGVSRRHACIRVDGPQASVEDLGSKNGTFVNGQPVREPVPLVDGNQVRLGTVVITFRIPPPPRSTDTVHPQAVVGPPLATDNRSVRLLGGALHGPAKAGHFERQAADAGRRHLCAYRYRIDVASVP